MRTQRLSMRRIREVLRLRHVQGLTERVIARTLRVSNGVVHGYLRRARLAGLSWPLPEGIDDEGLELLFFPAPKAASQSLRRPVPDWSYVEKELRRRGVTRVLLWEEYRAANPDGFGYTWFCTTFEAWKERARPTMRQTHLGGEKVFVDFAGDPIDIFDPITGEAHAMKLFVAAMGASNYTYAEACPSESLSDWIGVHTNLFAFLGGVPKFVVCDNLKAPVTNPDRLRPRSQPDLRRDGEPLRHRSTRGAAATAEGQGKVEVAVQIAQVLARLRNQRFFSLAELNAAIRVLVDELNARQMRGFGSSRAELFAEIDRPKLGALPDQPYVFARWKRCRVARLPRRGRRALVFHALPPDPGTPRRAHRRQRRRDLPQRPADRQPRPCTQPARPYDRCRSHAERASPLRQVDARRIDRGRREDRAFHRRLLPGCHR
ncbi:IS21 family transposase [Mesorhizobium sp. LNJC394B00]|uniref:IS21 family transposase n=1 Tax=Mesorhizobium sp. LNJC394B00 TaxID=1287274 RepID=UPI0018DD18AA|nr:IS21 family transposase [Mesorhizobium sp. LNJC394B00]